MKTITVKSSGLGRYGDVSPFILTNGKLELKINLPKCNGQFFYIAQNNATKFKIFIPEDGIISISGLTAGELNAEVKHYLKGVLIENYKVEPLLLCDVDESLSATPEIISLRDKNEALKNSVKQLKICLDGLIVNFAALLRFAYADYKNNIYLSGGSVDEFIKEFGVELSEEEREEIFKGVN